MAGTKILFYFLLSMCLVSLALSSPTYEEPDMEARTEEVGTAVDNVDDSDDDEEEASDENGDAATSDDSEISDMEMDKKSNDADNDVNTSSSDEVEDQDSGNNKGSTECKVTMALKTMGEYLQELGNEIDELKKQVAESCSAGSRPTSEQDHSKEMSGEDDDGTVEDDDGSGKDGSGSGDDDGSGEDDDKKPDCDDDSSEEEDDDDDSDEDSDEVVTTPEPTLPPPPTRCPSPFQLLANSCYYIQTDPREWRSFGEAMAFCRQQGGTLASPYRPLDLMEYLEQSYTNTLWVGGRLENDVWEWLDGREIGQDNWREGKPSNHPAKRCMYLDAWHNFKGVNHYCGEKFSFVCDHRGE